MDDLKIVTGVKRKDKKNLFASKIEAELGEIKNETDRLDLEVQKYEQLTDVLARLPQELGWSIPYLPLTRYALLPNATLTNTNEVQVHIGDGWFTRCSAHHAVGICRRRQEKCQSTKQKLLEREELLQEWLRVAQGQVGIAGGFQSQDEDGDDEVTACDAFNENEIQEFVTEEQYLAEKIEHEQKAREHYLRQRAAIKLQEEMFARTTDDEEDEIMYLQTRLEELEMLEESRGELKEDYSAAVTRKSPSKPEPAKEGPRVSNEVAETSSNNDSSTSNCEPEETVKLGWTWDDGSESSSSSEYSDLPQNEKKTPPRKLSFADHIKTGSDETSVIEFTHTPTEPLPSTNTTGILLSPSDIYANFQQVFATANTPPKSILKHRSQEDGQSSEFPILQYPPKETLLETEYQQVVLGDIIERKIEEPSLPDAAQKTENISMFKAARLAAKHKH